MITRTPRWLWKAELPDLVCDAIIKEGESQDIQKATTSGSQKQSEEDREATRKSKVSWLSTNWMGKLLWEYIIEANQKAGWNYQIQRFEPLQYTIYEAPGSHYEWHVDHTRPYIDGPNQGLLRKLSVSVQLSEPDSYEGGEFEQMYISQTTDGIIEKKVDTLTEVSSRGSILVFPGFVWHRVLPVTKGTRRSLVGWVVGEPFV